MPIAPTAIAILAFAGISLLLGLVIDDVLAVRRERVARAKAEG